MTSASKKSYAILLLVMAAIVLILLKVFHSPKAAPPPAKPQVELHDFKLVENEVSQKPSAPTWETITIKPHDTLQRIFTAQHLPQSDLLALIKLKDPRISRLQSGTKLQLRRDAHQALAVLKLPVGLEKELVLTRQAHGFNRTLVNLPVEIHNEYASGVVHTSLAGATKAAGLTPAMYAELIKMFQGRVNVGHDVRRGDRFAVLYESRSVNGKRLPTKGKLVAAKLMAHNQTYYAVRFGYPSHAESYFTPTGNSVESRFLPYPLRFKRISSHFSYSRFDPVIHAVRPHLGVDFAADSGTPVKAIGDGRITFIGKENGYGNSVRVSFDKHYSALYAHMHHFAKNVHLHQFIHKGDTIGYVGSTGWATGPHLHFSFYENGKPKNWLAVGHTSGTPVPKRYWGRFKAQAHTLLAKLDLGNNTHLAVNSDKPMKNIR